MKAPELTELAIEWLKVEHPESIIVTELSVADWGGARIDVAAITADDIVGIEIKGEGDSPTRLDLQGIVYGQVARRMWLLPTPDGTLAERCDKKRPAGWGRLEVHEGVARPVNIAQRLGPLIEDERGHKSRRMEIDPDTYKPSIARAGSPYNPWAMCGTLWRDELLDIARAHGIGGNSRTSVTALTTAIVNAIPVPKIHDAMIGQLRQRAWRKPVIDLRTGNQKIAESNQYVQGSMI